MFAERKPADLRMVAAHVGLAPCSVSAILNDTPAAKAIPQGTKDRVFRAAAELNYRPNLWARSLRTKRTRIVAAVASDFGRGPVAQVVAGVQRRLHEQGYLLALGSIDFADVNHLSAQFRQRGIEGLVAIDTPVPRQLELPIASVELGMAKYAEPLTAEMRSWLVKIGASAAETIMHQIENQALSRRLKVEGKPPSSYFGWAISESRTAVETRESA
jgi:hypothetical protein